MPDDTRALPPARMLAFLRAKYPTPRGEKTEERFFAAIIFEEWVPKPWWLFYIRSATPREDLTEKTDAIARTVYGSYRIQVKSSTEAADKFRLKYPSIVTIDVLPDDTTSMIRTKLTILLEERIRVHQRQIAELEEMRRARYEARSR